jgi:hypothetical protein
MPSVAAGPQTLEMIISPIEFALSLASLGKGVM